ncbi:hypothetical protein PR202_ga22585 [Eleusine coracana subsp. coracana]|uniref:TAFII28-like protein domain-containing protein n=1 Tax=Eleusine coracana subsp. coracana TaxID=191504 RepID=A0AAV5D420_ELECO|nr:hypothetical protein PR202_ga22585 [Eleusine coracana subsp. coracana]
MGQAVSSSREEDIPASDAAIGDEALAAGSSYSSPAASGVKAAASNAMKEEEAPAAGISAAVVGDDDKGGDETAAANGENKKKKKRTVRMPQAQVDHILPYTPSRALTVPAMSGFLDRLKAMITEAMGRAAQVLRESHLREQEWVRKQMEEKRYVEYEVDNDEEVVLMARRGRRRYCPGIRKTAGGSVKRVS